jgi:hypothetical protein
VVNFDQLRDRVATTIHENQCERLKKTRIRKSPLKLRTAIEHRADHELRAMHRQRKKWSGLTTKNVD